MKIYKKKLCAHTFGSITAGKDSSNSQRCNPFVPPVIFLSNGVVKGLGVSYGLHQGCMGSYAGTLVQSTYVLHIHPNTIQGNMGSYAGTLVQSMYNTYTQIQYKAIWVLMLDSTVAIYLQAPADT